MQLLYLGFVQQTNLRCFRFEGVAPRDKLAPKAPKLEFSLNADMALLARHRIPFQDVPGICLDILQQKLTVPDCELQYTSYVVTHADLTEYKAAKSTGTTETHRRRPRARFKPTDASQMKQPIA